MTIDEYRKLYRNFMNDAKSYGWTSAEFNARCEVLAAWRLDRYAGMARPEAFMLSAQEVFVEEILSGANA